LSDETQNKNEATPEESPEKNSRRKFVIIAVVILLVIGAGLFYWRSTYTEDTDDAQVDGDLYQVSSRVTGQVIKVYIDDNQQVQAGQAIAEIDPKDYQVALEQAQANLANAQAAAIQATVNVPITSVNVNTSVSTTSSDVQGSLAAVDQARKQAQAAEARVAQAKANAVKSHLDVERYTPLVEKDVISKQQFDAAVAADAGNSAAVLEAEATVIAQQAAVNQALQKLAQSRSTAAESFKTAPDQVRVQQAKANAALADIKQSQAKVDQEECAGWREPQHRAGPPDHHSADESLGHRQLQGDPVVPHASRPVGHDQGRCSRWSQISRNGHPDRRSHRLSALVVSS